MSWIERIGRYRAERLLGSGAFASVWLAHDELLDVPVAVKILADNWAAQLDVRARFVSEARLLRQADSDRVLRVMDIGELPDGRPYFVTSFADRGSLADRLQGAELAPERALDILVEVCESVCVLHEMGVVHRDLKPSNVLFKTSNSGAERVLLADLGIAKALAQGSGLTMMAGSPGYMAPEQAEFGAAVDERTDVYGLGALGHRLLAGRTAGPNGPAELPGRVGMAIRRAMELDPNRRWSSARALADELSAARSAQPAMALAVVAQPRTQLLPVMKADSAGPPTAQLPVQPGGGHDYSYDPQDAGPPAFTQRRRIASGWLVAAPVLLAIVAVLATVVATGGIFAIGSGQGGPDTGPPPASVIDVGETPNDVVLTASGDRALVTNATGRSVSVIDTSTGTVAKVITVDRYISDIAVTSDGRTAYVTNPASDAVLVLNLDNGTIATTIAVGDSPNDIVLDSDSRRAFVTNRDSRSVSVLDTSRNAVATTIAVGDHPAGLALTADKRTLYVANGGDSTVSVLDTTNNTVTRTVPTGGGGPVGIVLGADGRNAYLANITTGTVSVLNTGTNAVTVSAPLGKQVLRLAADPDGMAVYATVDTGTPTGQVVSLGPDGKVVERWTVGERPIGITITPDRSRVYVANAGSNTVSVLSDLGG